MDIKKGDMIRVVKGFEDHGLDRNKDYKVSFISLAFGVYVLSNKGYHVPLEKGEYVKVDSKKDIIRNPKRMECDVEKREFIPRFFKRNEKYSDPEDSYFHTPGTIYVEVPPERYIEFEFIPEDEPQEGDVILYTNCESTILVYYKHEIEEFFEEVF